MATNFPSSPTLNQVYTNGNRSWTWSGQFWQASSITTASAGATGYVGSQGTGGVSGYVGSQGIIGYAGSKGIDGIVGYNGSTGYTGSTGIGYVGSMGVTGYTGSTGIGYAGSMGITGYVGSIGFPGITGAFGYTGSASTVPGYAGSQGTAIVGYTGSAGSGGGGGGYTGSVGITGAFGYTGSAGASGTGGGGGSASVSAADTSPVSPTDGTMWLNSITGDFNVYYQGAWISVTGGSQVSTMITTSMFTGDGSSVNYSVGTGQSVDTLLVIDNGVTQVPTVDYTYGGGNVTFVTAPVAGASIQIRKFANSDFTSGTIDSLTDVNALAPTDGQALIWDSTSGFWIPGTTIASSTATTNIATSMFVGDGITTIYNIGTGYTANNLLVFDGGVSQVPAVDYTYAGTNITFVTAPVLGTQIQIRKLGTVSASSGTLIINDLSDVDTSSPPTNGQALLWNSTSSQWNPGNVAPVLSTTSINALSDVDTATATPTNGQVLLWDSATSQWIPGAVSTTAVGPTGADISTVTFSGTGSTLNFTVGTGFSADTLIVFDNGVSQIPDVDYTYTGTDITFVVAPVSDSTIQVRKIRTVSLSAAGLLNWSIINATVVLSARNGYFIDTTSGALSVTLPIAATLGDTIRINDLAGTFNTNNLTVSRNGHKIQGIASDLVVNTQNVNIDLIYSNPTYGWKLCSSA